jgi:hypothetical protein
MSNKEEEKQDQQDRKKQDRKDKQKNRISRIASRQDRQDKKDRMGKTNLEKNKIIFKLMLFFHHYLPYPAYLAAKRSCLSCFFLSC